MLTRQEIFDKALAGIVAQGCISSGPKGCLYYTTKLDGSPIKCAIGHLVPDEVAAKWEAKATHSPCGLPALVMNEHLQAAQDLEACGVPLGDQNFEFLCDLQDAHDMGKGLEGILEYFRQVAVEYHLDFNLPSNP